MYFLRNHRSGIRSVILLLILTVLLGGVLLSTMAYMVTQTDPVTNSFVSGVDPKGDLIIHKKLEHPFGEDHVVPEDLAFDFLVELGDAYAGQTVHTTEGVLTADAQGRILIQVRPGGSVGILDMPAGMSVKVTEQQASDGFQIQSAVSQEAVIVADQEQVITFVNRYVPEPADLSDICVIGIKELIGRPWQEGDSFTFQLDIKRAGEDDWTVLGTETISYGSENQDRFDFSEALDGVELDEVGVYAFRVRETEGTLGGITYDDTVGYFDVTVSDVDMDGALEISAVTGSGNVQISKDGDSWQVTITFRNYYAPEGDAQVTIHIQKILEDLSGQHRVPEGFVFLLFDENGELVATSQPTSAAGETGIKLVFDAEDVGKTFYYTLVEKDGGQTLDGITYDSSVYTLEITVVDGMDGTIRAEIRVVDGATGQPSDVCTVTFVNIYEAEKATVQIEGIKYLLGRDMVEQEFRFRLYETGEDFTIQPGQTPVAEAGNAADGRFAFDTLEYHQVGTYYYVACEDTSQTLGGICYDTTAYRITVTVTDEDGVLTATYTVTDVYGQTVGLEFVNEYSVQPTTVSFPGEKRFTGARLTEGLFRFRLFEADESFQALPDPIETTVNDENGLFTFQSLTYTEPGTYYYVIVEDSSDPVEGVVYDDTVYAVTVTVTDDLQGALQSEVGICVLNGGDVEGIVFENVYRPGDDPGAETGDKPLSGYLIIAAVAILSLTVLVITYHRSNRKYEND